LHGPHVADGLVHYIKLKDNISVKSMFILGKRKTR
jgi:hypothetical protein